MVLVDLPKFFASKPRILLAYVLDKLNDKRLFRNLALKGISMLIIRLLCLVEKGAEADYGPARDILFRKLLYCLVPRFFFIEIPKVSSAMSIITSRECTL